MDIVKAKEILSDSIQEEGLYNSAWYLGWDLNDHEANLDGEFTADELEAVAFYMRLKGKRYNND